MTFGDFDVDERAGVLRRGGVRIRLQDLPFRLLVVLLRRAGSVVTRDELRAELWGSETFVDAEAGLNTAIAKIREALGDNADTPAFIETLPKRGYRFIGRLEPAAGAIGTHSPAAQSPAARPPRALVVGAIVLAASVLALAAWFAFGRQDRVTIAVVRFHNETGVAANDRIAGTLTDAVVVALASNPRYGVIGNSPLLITDRIFQDVQKIGEALHADYVVLGQLQTGDNGLLARAHFIRVSDQKHLWAGKIDLPATDTERVLTSKVSEGVAIGLSRGR
jgi:DNA-binding winged helix-turn-helix (wHTH) protein/TolB-like protein